MAAMTTKKPTKKTTKKGHTCIAEINQLLAPRNGQLVGALSLSNAPPRVYVAVDKLDAGKKLSPPMLAASFCPFCGKKEE